MPYGIINPVSLNELNYLPSINVIYKIKNDTEKPINARFNFSQTLARPSLRELAAVTIFDYELNASVEGNPDLQIVHVNNYDMRLESYFKSGDNVSLSLFYKDFINYIELTTVGSEFQWLNDKNKARLEGFEIEGKKRLTKNFELSSNITWVKSQSLFELLKRIPGSTTYESFGFVKQPLYGQAPYIFNAILNYKADSIGLILTMSYNIQGPKIVIQGFKEIPNVYELPRHLIDLKISKKLGKYFSMSFKINDILNAPIRRTYNFPVKGFIVDYDKYRYGTNYTVSVSYKF